MEYYFTIANREIKQTLKATAAIIGIIAALVILNYIMKAFGCLLIYISEAFNIPL